MTVIELIKELQKLNPEAKVEFLDIYNDYREITDCGEGMNNDKTPIVILYSY